MQTTRGKVGPYSLQDFTLFHVLRYGFRPRKIAFLAWHAWHDVEPAPGRPGSPRTSAPSYDAREIRRWLEVFRSGSSRSASSSGPRCPTGRRSARRFPLAAR